MTVLGLSCWYHDAAAAVVRDGVIVAAAQEERFTRRKHDSEFPANAVAYCLAEAGIAAADLDAVAFYDKPLLKFERLLETFLTLAPRGLPAFLDAMPPWLRQKLWIGDRITDALGGKANAAVRDLPLLFPEHHESHAAAAFFPSPFERAAFLTTDGVGEWATTSWGVGAGAGLEIRAEQHFPHSLGLLYSAVTTFCGFRVNSGEYKLMGLAPYGRPVYRDLILDRLVDLKADGSFRLDQRYFTYAGGRRMTGRAFADLFGGPARVPEAPITTREMDLAASVQAVTEEIVLRMARHVHAETGEDSLCLAGGVALNCVANGRLLREGPFRNVWIQPAAGDAGGALGAALMATHVWAGTPRTVCPSDAMRGARLGPAFSEPEIADAFAQEAFPPGAVETFESDAALVERVARLLAAGQTVGWFQGRAEFGPRALGGRSILADPRGADVQHRVNVQVKFRESFRPFAPSVLEERAADWFDLAGRSGLGDGGEAEPPDVPAANPPSPYMLLVGPVRGAEALAERGAEALAGRYGVASPLPAVTHVDGSARVQTVTRERAGLYYDLLLAFERATATADAPGCPVLVNTSFNVRGEPIVHSPADALRVFRQTGIDALAVGRHVITKAALPEADRVPLTPAEIAAAYGLD
ncbi:MAG TPA: carbamoyltransferase N-terminal domain-containing protein [Rubricoccaceae bacterium]|jgi:carbamoyltransferase